MDIDRSIQDLQKCIEKLQAEKEQLEAKCQDLEALQISLEQAIEDAARKQLEAEMTSMELEQVFSACEDAMWVVREDGIVVRANGAMLKLLDKPRTEVVGRPCMELLCAPICTNGNCPLPRAHQAHSFFHFEIERGIHSDEMLYYLVSTASLVTLDGSAGLVAQFKDITKRRRAEEALSKANRALEQLVNVDGLTQLANRRFFDERLAQEWRRMEREGKPLALVMCDIDFFKKYNDTYGHQGGDDCLKKVAQALSKSVKRPGDLAARYGGEEFVLLLPDTTLDGAIHTAQRARLAVQDMAICHEASTVADTVTLSLGVAARIPIRDTDPEALIQITDEALYRSKERGRNRVTAGNTEIMDRGLHTASSPLVPAAPGPAYGEASPLQASAFLQKIMSIPGSHQV